MNFSRLLFRSPTLKHFSKFLSKSELKDRIKVVKNKPSNQKEAMSSLMKDNLDKNLELIEHSSTKDNQVISLPFEKYITTVDTSFESFFLKREYSLQTFNFFLQVLAKKGEASQAYSTLKTMREIGIEPDFRSYNSVMAAYAKQSDIAKCESLMDEMKERGIILSVNIFCTLLNAYANNDQPQKCEGIIKEMTDLGLTPNIQVYTSLIKAYKNVKNYKKCWEIYDEILPMHQPDEFVLSFMIGIARHTRDAEKALKIWDFMQSIGSMQTTINYNNLIGALSSRGDYANKAIEMFDRMNDLIIPKDRITYIFALTAVSKLGNVRQANEVLKEMKINKIAVDKAHLTALLKCYGEACLLAETTDEDRQQFVKDAFEIYNMIEESEEPVEVNQINGLLEVCCAAYRLPEIDGIIIPLFARHNLEMNSSSFEVMMRMFARSSKYSQVIKLFKQLEDQELKKTAGIVNLMLEASIAKGNSDGVVTCLRNFKEMNLYPHYKFLRKLANMKELPDSVYCELLNFPKVGLFNSRIRQFKAPSKHDRYRPKIKKFRMGGKKVK